MTHALGFCALMNFSPASVLFAATTLALARV
jgi:hypothetical protein